MVMMEEGLRSLSIGVSDARLPERLHIMVSRDRRTFRIFCKENPLGGTYLCPTEEVKKVISGQAYDCYVVFNVDTAGWIRRGASVNKPVGVSVCVLCDTEIVAGESFKEVKRGLAHARCLEEVVETE